MKKLISFRFATNASLALFIIFTLFHLSVILGIILFDYAPVDYLWGGRMQTSEELLIFEIFSLVVQIIAIFIVLLRAGFINNPALKTSARIAIWILFVLFLLNTIGNILAETWFERFMGIITLILAVLMFRLAIEKNN